PSSRQAPATVSLLPLLTGSGLLQAIGISRCTTALLGQRTRARAGEEFALSDVDSQWASPKRGGPCSGGNVNGLVEGPSGLGGGTDSAGRRSRGLRGGAGRERRRSGRRDRGGSRRSGRGGDRLRRKPGRPRATAG